MCRLRSPGQAAGGIKLACRPVGAAAGGDLYRLAPLDAGSLRQRGLGIRFGEKWDFSRTVVGTLPAPLGQVDPRSGGRLRCVEESIGSSGSARVRRPFFCPVAADGIDLRP
jgi:hypothetical protein